MPISLPKAAINSVAFVTALSLAALAVAQEGPIVPQPPVDKAQLISPALGYGVIFLLVMVVLGVSLMPSKRSHLD
ncbi:MAG: hypothetical protein EXS00_07400 [Phycisphaerales bacterium]|nr:hypothetical protein [Phycisphaerales bacterium]